jgi:hypothetical protein
MYRFICQYIRQYIRHATATPTLGDAGSRSGNMDGMDVMDGMGDDCGASPPRLVLHSGHDITLVPMLRALGAWTPTDGWPGYGCALRIELMEDLHERSEERGADGHGGGSGAFMGNGYSMVDAPESAFAVDRASPSGVGEGGGGGGSLVGMYVRIFWHVGFRDAIET